MLMDQVDLMDLMDKMGAPRDNPRVCCAVGRWGAWGQIYRRGVQAMMATVVCRLRRRGACISRISRISRISQIYGCVTVYPEGLPVAVWFGSGLKVAAG